MDKEQAIEIIETHSENISSSSLVGRALDIAIDALKAQLSKKDTTKGATSDLISRMETVEHLRRVLEATVPNTDYDEGYIDGIEFGISTVSTMPPAQPQSTAGQPNDGVRSTARSTNLIDRQQTLDALIYAVKNVGILDADDIKAVFDMLPTIQPVATDTNVGDTISRQWLLECIKDGWIKFDTDKDANRFIHLVRDIAPTIQPEKRTEKRTETHACDLISRQAAIDALGKLHKEDIEDYGCEIPEGFNQDNLDRAIFAIKQLPTVQPERKKGEWIEISSINHTYKCSECGRLLVNVADGRNNVSKHYPYCHCGADMKGGSNE